MYRVNEILNNPIYKENLDKIKILERDRIFCKHDLEHFINVARICYIINLERNLGFAKEIIYIIALLHDIGRGEQYEKGTPHEIASYEIAKEIIKDIHFSLEEQRLIEDGIIGHRKNINGTDIGKLMYEGDKVSRECYSCPSKSLCNWKDEKKNLKIKY